MNAEDLEAVRAAVLHAATLAPEQQEEYLRRVLAREDLRAEARSLLTIDPAAMDLFAGDGLKRMAEKAVATDESDPAVGSSIGPYRLESVLGRGGMGVVYRARQIEPFERDVALKLLRAQATSHVLLRRFELEQQLLGRLDHPNIAKALDAAHTGDGRPYFVLEFVDGAPIGEYCRRQAFSLRDRLVLFLQVCRAVDHAHRRGIIHRDLKPSNILVAEHDGRPVVKVIDFGVARVLEELSAESTFATVDGHVLGTPHYMSPEQARGDRARVDTRSDLYSLGVILHELLTEELPYDLNSTSAVEVLRVVVHESARIARRSSTGASLPGDLRTILGCALESEPERRYATVRHFADDIERYLDHQPLFARRPSSMYVLRKVVERHPMTSVALLVLLLVVVGSTIALSILYQRESRSRVVATREADRVAAVLQYVEGVLAASRPMAGGPDRPVGEVLIEAVEKARTEFTDRPELRTVILRTLAVSLGSNDRWKESEAALLDAFEASRAIEPPDPLLSAQIQLDLAGLDRSKGNGNGAVEHARRGLELLDAGRLESPKIRGALHYELGYGLRASGRMAAAESVSAVHRTLVARHFGEASPEYATVLATSAEVAWGVGKPKEALGMIQNSLRIRESLGETSGPEYLRSLNLLGVSQNATGDHEASIETHRRIVGVATRIFGAEHSATASFSSNLATSLLGAGRFAEADPLVRESLRVWRATLGDGHPNVATGYNNLGFLLQNLGRFDEAARSFERALTLVDSTGSGDPIRRSSVCTNLAYAEFWRGRTEMARDRFRRVVEDLSPVVPRSHNFLLGAATGLGLSLLELGDAGAALAVCDSFLVGLDPEVAGERVARIRLQHLRSRAIAATDPRLVDREELLAARAGIMENETPLVVDLFEISRGELLLRTMGDEVLAAENAAWLQRHPVAQTLPRPR